MTSSSLQEITALLAKKNSFMQAVQMLTELVTTTYRTSAEAARQPLFNACKRSFTLLCSRYMAIGFWRVGKDLFSAVVIASSDEPARVKLAKEWLLRATEEVSKGDEESKGSSEPAAQTPTAQSTTQHVPPPPRPSLPAEEVEARGPEALRDILQQYVRDVDVEQLLSLIQLQTGSDPTDTGPPPASREARFNLGVKTITDKEVLCCVCQEEFAPGGKAKMMPCGHAFHYDCLMEWLERHNSCPTCRYALPSEKPTFDLAQERVASRDVRGTQLYS
mmetsp:Transcript_44603/g.71726  ORF Transcript_44603/g.71726 Transcript_44603/m.71726 type:complete len:276 (+) Transcript_44603:181-1008(+)